MTENVYDWYLKDNHFLSFIFDLLRNRKEMLCKI